MKEKTRLEEILEILAVQPEDPFVIYAVAMEYKNQKNFIDAEKYFRQLLTKFPQYVPQYLMYGDFLVSQNNLSEASRIYTQGIEIAKKLGQSHAQSELESALKAISD